MKIRILKVAKQDLNNAVRFYDVQHEGQGKRFLDSLRRDMRSLSQNAGIHAREYGCQRMLAQKYPYAIFYRVTGGSVVVVAVLDMRRDPAMIERKLNQR